MQQTITVHMMNQEQKRCEKMYSPHHGVVPVVVAPCRINVWSRWDQPEPHVESTQKILCAVRDLRERLMHVACRWAPFNFRVSSARQTSNRVT
jgi:hypothetical protein